MDPFYAEKQALRAHPTFIQALATQPVMGHHCPLWYRNSSYRNSMKLIEAGLKMDHLFRRALACDNSDGVIEPNAASAIAEFVRHVERTMPSMVDASADALHQIQQRLDFAKLIIDLCERERAARGWDRVTHDNWFENTIVMPYGYTMDQIVYTNPFETLCTISGGFSGVASMDTNLRTLYVKIRNYWP